MLKHPGTSMGQKLYSPIAAPCIGEGRKMGDCPHIRILLDPGCWILDTGCCLLVFGLACLKLRIRVQGFDGIEIEIAIESFISAGHFSSIPIAISISIWSFFSDKSGRSAAGGPRLYETMKFSCRTWTAEHESTFVGGRRESALTNGA